MRKRLPNDYNFTSSFKCWNISVISFAPNLWISYIIDMPKRRYPYRQTMSVDRSGIGWLMTVLFRVVYSYNQRSLQTGNYLFIPLIPINITRKYLPNRGQKLIINNGQSLQYVDRPTSTLFNAICPLINIINKVDILLYLFTLTFNTQSIYKYLRCDLNTNRHTHF